MANTLRILLIKLAFLGLLSTHALVASSGSAVAHELVPTIVDMERTDDETLTLSMRVNIEAFLSGIDLDAVADTDEVAEGADYDSLRALSAEALRERLPDLVAAWNAVPLAETDGPLTFAIDTVEIPEGVDPELARISILTLAAPMDPAATTVTVNWPDGGGAMVLRQQGVDAPYTGYLAGGESSIAVNLAGGDAQDAGGAFLSYIPVGFDHILPKGLDHILFVLGLFFLSTRWRPLLFQVTAFTLAHTVTLALGALGLVNVPGSIVEPLIAASIVYVAVENVFHKGLSRWRPAVIFGFGLLHGLGFASVLAEFGLPEDQFIPALIGFNVGVELGQLTVIALAALLLFISVRLARRMDLDPAEAAATTYPVMFRSVSVPASLLIAAVGAWWTIERVFF
ncbi:HupE/UreJ family protein [Roseobacter ponti]|uniref:HupE/UreJ family protein n=1 Tax=Roseobacter ponti TaxID=1891787 RepID=A0A858SU05_9RHOB|nr:HupE/UreJ family protein [Roseobacter ponti]QJF51292.1 HupE/UreJ family protein [Roseobacter ponti]